MVPVYSAMVFLGQPTAHLKVPAKGMTNSPNTRAASTKGESKLKNKHPTRANNASRIQLPIQLEATICSRDRASRPNRFNLNNKVKERVGSPGEQDKRHINDAQRQNPGRQAGTRLGDAGQ